MRTVELLVSAPGVEPDRAYALVSDFARYSELVEVVRSVAVRDTDTVDIVVSDWEVYFRNGILRWTEADVFDTAARNIEFEQRSGDFHIFHGHWRVEAAGAGCTVGFEAEFDFGIPSLAGILDPIAQRVLRETIALVLRGLLGEITVVGDDALTATVLEKSSFGGAAREKSVA
ncbi:SRPBCC family protein [Nocardia sp. NPDC006630]|uniref:type II toxin-antitoxin system RatA family toxin n=1 Tax=Nocardia sp. NPDC006630 TaxID=3157181 RepID=UPI0033A6E711